MTGNLNAVYGAWPKLLDDGFADANVLTRDCLADFGVHDHVHHGVATLPGRFREDSSSYF